MHETTEDAEVGKPPHIVRSEHTGSALMNAGSGTTRTGAGEADSAGGAVIWASTMA